jgi:hypothetical protein
VLEMSHAIGVTRHDVDRVHVESVSDDSAIETFTAYPLGGHD